MGGWEEGRRREGEERDQRVISFSLDPAATIALSTGSGPSLPSAPRVGDPTERASKGDPSDAEEAGTKA
eukprot:3771832-Rhodomonas_salina.1